MFNKKKVKKSLKDFEKLKDYPIFSVLIIECEAYRNFFDSIFSKGEELDHYKSLYER